MSQSFNIMLFDSKFISKAVVHCNLPTLSIMYFKDKGFKTISIQYKFLLEAEIIYIAGNSLFTEIGLDGVCWNGDECATGLICDPASLTCSMFQKFLFL